MAVKFILNLSLLIVLVVSCTGTPVPNPHHERHDYQRPVVVAAVPYRPQTVLVPVRPVNYVASVPIRTVPVVAAPIQYG